MVGPMPASHVLEGWLSFSALGVAGESMVGVDQDTPAVAATRCAGLRHPPRKE